jgi:hypothetical protein
LRKEKFDGNEGLSYHWSEFHLNVGPEKGVNSGLSYDEGIEGVSWATSFEIDGTGKRSV